MNGRPRYLIVLTIFCVGILLALILSLGLARHSDARAASVLIVDTLADELNNDGDCSLREAIAAANGNIATDACPAGDAVISDTIHFSVSGTIVLTSQLQIAADSPVVIQAGQTISISGSTTVGVLKVNGGADLTLIGLTIADGKADVGGGIYNLGTLSLISTTVSNNVSSFPGGGIRNSGWLSITDSKLSGNQSDFGGGGLFNYGVATIISSTFIGNHVGFEGGAISNIGVVTITNSTISGNDAHSDGGGIYSNGTGDPGVGWVYLTNSTVSGNSSYYDGGGIYASNGGLRLYNATISANSAGGEGGGLLSIVDFRLRNSLIAGNTAGTIGPDCSTLDGISEGYNLIQNTSNCSFTSGPGDQVFVNAYLGPLQDNGGPTWTHALLPMSSAIDGGDPAGCSDHNGNLLTADQRGLARQSGCDIGAFEFIGVPLRQKFIHLPLVFDQHCADFLDDFSNPNSGWWVGDDSSGLADYLNGEYRILVRPVDTTYVFGSPACFGQNYQVEIDARWGGSFGVSYGLLFGIQGDFDQFYSLEIYPEYNMYSLYRYDSSGWIQIVPFSVPYGVVHPDAGTNHLSVLRDGANITLSINGNDLGTVSDSAISGLSGTGVIVSTYDDQGNADARFDNFRLTRLPDNPVAITAANDEPDRGLLHGLMQPFRIERLLNGLMRP